MIVFRPIPLLHAFVAITYGKTDTFMEGGGQDRYFGFQPLPLREVLSVQYLTWMKPGTQVLRLDPKTLAFESSNNLLGD
jgi:hypothetical protein